eukprot:scaffold518_cov388-Prasinococcus_capsulatus_cf.AAC.1
MAAMTRGQACSRSVVRRPPYTPSKAASQIVAERSAKATCRAPLRHRHDPPRAITGCHDVSGSTDNSYLGADVVEEHLGHVEALLALEALELLSVEVLDGGVHLQVHGGTMTQHDEHHDNTTRV